MAGRATKNDGANAQAQPSRKKRSKGRTDSPAPSATGSGPNTKPVSVNPGETQEYENPQLKELSRAVRNANKKLSNVSRTESIVAANPDKSLDELVADKIINADQKAQILTKPSLKARLAEAEEQLRVYKKVYSEYQEQRVAEKKQLEESLAEKHKKELEEVAAEAEAKADKKLRDSLLSVSQFLAVAAARRGDDFDPEEDENRALEGCLMQVYYGNDAGVEAMLKISGASDEKTMSFNGDRLETTYGQVKEIASAFAAALYPPVAEPASAAEKQEVAPAEPTPEPSVEAEPTQPAATASQVNRPESTTPSPSNGRGGVVEAPNGAPTNANVADEAANDPTCNSPTANESGLSRPSIKASWDPSAEKSGPEITSVAKSKTQSWSDEVHEASSEAPPTPAPQKPADDGFTSVQRRREPRGDAYRGRGRGGRGRGDAYRGRGSRGDRGRGRGGMGGSRRPDAS